MQHITPALSDDELLADIRAAGQERVTPALWWLGQSGFLLAWQGAYLLLDPYLSDSLTRKYAGTPKPHIRMTAIPIQPERLAFVQAVTSSHNHTDHLDAETLLPLLAANPELPVIVSAANRAFAAERLAVAPERLTGITRDKPVSIGPFTLYAVPAAHEQREQDEAGHEKYIGLVVQAGPHTIYHSGDTLRYEGMAELLRQWRIGIALLPINGRDPARGVAGNLSGAEAAQLAHDSGARLVIPCHYDMFTFNTASPDEFIGAAESLGQGYRVLRCGERFTW
jgi:L-ascorbate metabolism protein UlaG (beta-lactamase superfamily)